MQHALPCPVVIWGVGLCTDLSRKDRLHVLEKDSNKKTRMKENMEEIVDLKRLYMHFCKKKINKKN